MAVKSSYRVFLKFLIIDCSDCYRLKIAPFKIPKVQKKKKKEEVNLLFKLFKAV